MLKLLSEHKRPLKKSPTTVLMRDCLMHPHAKSNIIELSLYFFCFQFIFVLVALKILPAYAMILMIIISNRGQLIYHEICHCRERVPFFLNLVLYYQGILSVGFTESRKEHLKHHRHLHTPQDGDWWLNKRKAGQAFIASLFYHEFLFFSAWKGSNLKEKKNLIFGCLIRSTFFLGAIYLVGVPFLVWFFLPCRFMLGVQYYVFTYVLHRRGNDFGTYPIKMHPILEKTFGKIQFGSKWLDAVHYHDVHHEYPTIAVQHLHLFADGTHSSCKE